MSHAVEIPPIQGVQGTLYTIPVTPIRAVTPATRADAQPKADAPPAPPTPEQTRTQAVAQAVQQAAPRQTSLAPLFADLAQALKGRPLPAPVQQAAAQVAAQAVPLSPAISAETISRAFAQSGLFLERNLGAKPGESPQGRDLKAGLLDLRQALEDWLGEARTGGARGGDRPPPPPFRGGPTSAQPAARGGLPADASSQAVGQRLADEVEGALARHELMQAASLPQPPSGTDPASARWMFEIPFASPQGATVAQFEISREDEEEAQGRAAGQGPTYRARFSVDLSPLGPTHAQVALRGDHANVALWAERGDSAAQLHALKPLLAGALTRAGLAAEVVVYPGQPPARAPGAGQFVAVST